MLSADTKQTTTMQHAIANASPAIRSRIRKVTYNSKPGAQHRVLNFIFDDDKLSGRYFSLGLSNDMAVIWEVDKPTKKGLGYCMAKQAGGKGVCMVAFTCASTDNGVRSRTFQNTKFRFNVDNFSQSPPHGVAPDWSGGKLKYKVKLPYVDMISAAEETAAELTTSNPVAAATPPSMDRVHDGVGGGFVKSNPSPAMPRLSTIKSMLNDLRKIERDTPYRLERDNDGVLHFVARIG